MAYRDEFMDEVKRRLIGLFEEAHEICVTSQDEEEARECAEVLADRICQLGADVEGYADYFDEIEWPESG